MTLKKLVRATRPTFQCASSTKIIIRVKIITLTGRSSREELNPYRGTTRIHVYDIIMVMSEVLREESRSRFLRQAFEP